MKLPIEVRQGQIWKDRSGRRFEVETIMGPFGARAGHPGLHIEARNIETHEVKVLGHGLFRRRALVPVAAPAPAARRRRS